MDLSKIFGKRKANRIKREAVTPEPSFSREEDSSPPPRRMVIQTPVVSRDSGECEVPGCPNHPGLHQFPVDGAAGARRRGEIVEYDDEGFPVGYATYAPGGGFIGYEHSLAAAKKHEGWAKIHKMYRVKGEPKMVVEVVASAANIPRSNKSSSKKLTRRHTKG